MTPLTFLEDIEMKNSMVNYKIKGKIMKKVLVLLMMSLAISSFLSASQEETQINEELKVIVREVRVHVLDKKGNHVEGLTKKDFVVKENGEEMEIQFFEEVDLRMDDLSLTQTEAKLPMEASNKENDLEELTTPVTRTILVLLDSSHMTQEQFDSVLESASEFIQYDMRNTDLVKIVHLDKVLTQVTPFTNNRARLNSGLADLVYHGDLRSKLSNMDRQIGQAIGDYMEDLNNSSVNGEFPIYLEDIINMTRSNRGGAQLLENRLSDSLIEPLIQAQSGRHIINDLAGQKEQIKLGHFHLLQNNLKVLGNMLKYMPGHKSIFYFSGGSFLEKGGRMQDSIPLMNEVARVLNSADTTIYSFHANQKLEAASSGSASSPYILSLGLMESTSKIISFTDGNDPVLRTNNTVVENSIHSSTGPVAAARETGGAYLESNKTDEIRSSFDQINAASSRFYRIAFLSGISLKRTKVEIKLDNADYKLRYGRHFMPGKTYDQLTPEELAISTETSLLYGRMANNEIKASVGYSVIKDDKNRLRMPVYLRIPNPPKSDKGFQIGFASIDDNFGWLDRTISLLPSLSGKSDLVFYDLLIPDTLPHTLRFLLRNLDNGKQSLYSISEIGQDASEALVLLGDPEPKNLVAMNHVRKDPVAIKGRTPLDTMRKDYDPFWFKDYLFVPSTVPTYEANSMIDIFFTAKGTGFSTEHARYFLEDGSTREALMGRILRKNFRIDGYVCLVARVELPVVTPGTYSLTVEIQEPGKDVYSMNAPFKVKASGEKPSQAQLAQRLFDMIDRENISQVKSLISLGTNINIRDSMGNTPLIAATQKNNLPVALELMEMGADVNTANNQGATPLMIASSWGSLEMAQELLTRGSNPNTSDFNKNTPLSYAASGGHLKLVQELLEAGSNVNQVNDRSETPLILAVRSNQPKVIRALVKSGASLDYLDSADRDPLVHAVLTRSNRSVKELLDLGANVNGNGKTKVSPLMYAAITHDMKTIKLLIKKGADLNGAEVNGNTALALISELGYTNIVHNLTKLGAKVNTRNAMGETPLMAATINNHTGTAKVLIEAGAQVNDANKGVTPLMLAAINGQLDMVKTLMKKGASPTQNDGMGMNALDYAKKGGSKEVVEYLADQLK